MAGRFARCFTGQTAQCGELGAFGNSLCAGGIQVQLHNTNAIAHFLREQHVVRQFRRPPRRPARERRIKIAGVLPFREVARVGAIRFAGETHHAPRAHLPPRHAGRVVFVLRHHSNAGAFAGVREIVAAQRRWRPLPLRAERAEVREDFHGGCFLDEGVARHGKGVLREDARNFRGSVGEINIPFTKLGNVLQ